MFYTPRGLRIEIPTKTAFSYLGRIHPQKKAKDVLFTIEHMQYFPGSISYLTLLVLLLLNSHWSLMIILPLIVGSLALIISLKSFFTDMVSKIGFFFSKIHSVFRWTLIYVLAFHLNGLMGISITLSAVIVSAIGRYVFEIVYCRIFFGKLTAPEIGFFLAYDYHASKLGHSQLDDILSDEMESGNWQETLIEYGKEFPKAVDNLELPYVINTLVKM